MKIKTLWVVSVIVAFHAIALPATAWTPTSEHPWPMFHGNYNHTGYADVKGPRSGTLKWKFKAASGEENSQPPNSIAIAKDGTIFLGSPTKVYALNAKGKEKWSKSYTNNQGPAISENGKTLYISGDNSLIALSAKNGKHKWTVEMGDSTLFGPTIGPDGTIYQASWDSYLYAISKKGKRKWRYQTEGALSYPASINEKGHIIFGGGDAHAGPDPYIYALSPKGKLRWKYDTDSERSGSPAIAPNGTIYVPSAPTLFALKANGSLKWSMGPTGTTATNDPGESPIGDDDDEDVGDGEDGGEEDDEDTGDGEDGEEDEEDDEDTDGEEEDDEDTGDGEDDEDSEEGGSEDKGDVAGIITPAIGPDGRIYIGNSQGEILGIDPDVQEVLWTYETGTDPDDSTRYGLPSFPVVDKKGVVYIGSVDRYMYALSKSGELLWKYETGGAIGESAPALGPDGTLYFSSDDGYLYAIER